MFAYLDAGSGSMIMAAVAGGVAGLGVLLRMYGNRILGVISPRRRARADAARDALLGHGADDG